MSYSFNFIKEYGTFNYTFSKKSNCFKKSRKHISPARNKIMVIIFIVLFFNEKAV